MNPTRSEVHHRSLPEARIALFRSLFRGRVDVYPRRFGSQTIGTSGYAPAFGNESVRGLCEKQRVKCTTCVHRKFLPVTDDAIRWHLSGQDRGGAEFTAGVYPMLLDETCFFLWNNSGNHALTQHVAKFKPYWFGLYQPTDSHENR